MNPPPPPPKKKKKKERIGRWGVGVVDTVNLWEMNLL